MKDDTTVPPGTLAKDINYTLISLFPTYLTNHHLLDYPQCYLFLSILLITAQTPYIKHTHTHRLLLQSLIGELDSKFYMVLKQCITFAVN